MGGWSHNKPQKEIGDYCPLHMNTNQWSINERLIRRLRTFASMSPYCTEDEMTFNYEVAHALQLMGLEIIRGHAYDTNRCIVSKIEDGVIKYRYTDARAGGLYDDAMHLDQTHTGRSKSDIYAVNTNPDFYLRYELKTQAITPDVRCWNQPFRTQVIVDFDKHLLGLRSPLPPIGGSRNAALILVMDEGAHLRAQGEPWEDIEIYYNRAYGVIPPVNPNIATAIHPLANIKALDGEILDGIRSWRGTDLRVLSCYVPVVGVQPREMVLGTDSSSRLRTGGGFQCTQCAFTGAKRDCEAHYRANHDALRQRCFTSGRTINIISTV